MAQQGTARLRLVLQGEDGCKFLPVGPGKANDILDQVLLSYPVQNGIIEDFEKFHLLLEYTLHERLHVDPEGRSILMTEPPHNPKSNREDRSALNEILCLAWFEEGLTLTQPPTVCETFSRLPVLLNGWTCYSTTRPCAFHSAAFHDAYTDQYVCRLRD